MPRPRRFEIPFEKHVLENGLSVVLHADRSAPVVAVHVVYRVGSAREEPGRSGLAHLFEHMLFQGSRHVGANEHFRLVQEAGGTLNGTTNQDRTSYFETLPANELELALWLESDRMGFLLPALTQEKLDNQREVVMNERRQSYENRPYGLVHETCLAALYPAGHPYHTPTIGSMEDVRRATLDDVAGFFRRWYAPGNAVLVLGGDFEPAHALARVERWFGALPRGSDVAPLAPEPVQLAESRRVVLPDRVAQPELTLVWPTVEGWHPDEPALNLLAEALSADKSALLDRVLVTEEELASEVTIAHRSQELAGALQIALRPHAGVSLAELERRLEELLGEVAVQPARAADAGRLERLKRRREGIFVRGLETVAARTSALASYECLCGDPGRIERDLERHRQVDPDDLRRAAERYLAGRPRVVVTVVPREAAGAAPASAAPSSPRVTSVALSALPAPTVHGSGPAPAAVPSAGAARELDRTRRPPPAEELVFRSPRVERRRAADGFSVLAAPDGRVPCVRVAIGVDAGRLHEAPGQLGLASLTAALLEEGTRRADGATLVDELHGLGATLDVTAGDDEILFDFAVLEEHLEAGLDLLGEVLLEPRFAPQDFERLRRKRLLEIATRADRIRELAADGFAALLFGLHSVLGQPPGGRRETVEALSVDDVRGFWSTHLRPEGMWVALVGAAGPEALAGRLAVWSARLGLGAARAPAPPGAQAPRAADARALYLLDKPGAAQSELRVGHPSLARSDPEFFALQALNHPLGGSFASRLNLNLREDKGFTYGAGSAFGGGRSAGTFAVWSAVETVHTPAALREVLDELRGAQRGFREEEAQSTRRALGQSLLRAYESSSARLAFLTNLARYGWPDDYPERRLAWLAGLTAAKLDDLARRHLRPEEALVLVVGDAAHLRAELAGGGFGPLVELDPYGRPA